MLTNRFPFHFADTKAMHQEMTNYPAFIRTRFNDHNSPLVRDLIETIFHPSDRVRPTMAEVLKHKWILTKGK